MLGGMVDVDADDVTIGVEINHWIGCSLPGFDPWVRLELDVKAVRLA